MGQCFDLDQNRWTILHTYAVRILSYDEVGLRWYVERARMWCTSKYDQPNLNLFINLICNGADILADDGIGAHWLMRMDTSTQKSMRRVARLVMDWYSVACKTGETYRELKPKSLRPTLIRALANLDCDMRRAVVGCAPRQWALLITNAHRDLEDERNARLDPMVTAEIERLNMRESRYIAHPQRPRVDAPSAPPPLRPPLPLPRVDPPRLAATPLATTPLAPTPLAPTPLAPTPLAATPLATTPLAPTPLAPTPLAPTPLAPTPLAPTPLAPTPLAPTPLAPTPLHRRDSSRPPTDNNNTPDAAPMPEDLPDAAPLP